MDDRRKRLLFRARHMGTNENDLLFGRFAERWLPRFDETQLDRFEALIGENDPDLFLWVTGAKPLPGHLDTDVMRLLQNFTVAGQEVENTR